MVYILGHPQTSVIQQKGVLKATVVGQNGIAPQTRTIRHQMKQPQTKRHQMLLRAVFL